MIGVARRRFAARDVTFHVGPFEDVEIEGGPFDAVFSATAFHWVDPKIGWAKAAGYLKPGGLMALLSYVNVRDEQSRALQDAFASLLHKHAPEVAAEWRQPTDFGAILAGVEERRGNASEVWDWLMRGGLQRPTMAVPEAASLFQDVEVASETYTVEQTVDELQAMFRTTAMYQRLGPTQREALEADERRAIESNGGTVRFSLAVLLMTARRATSFGLSYE